MTDLGAWLDGKPVMPADVQSRLDTLAASIPQASTVQPSVDITGGAIGTANGMYALALHSHPRMTSVTKGVLAANSLSGNINFTRAFPTQPGVVLTPIIPGGTQPVMLQVESWLKDGNGNFTGCVVRGYRTNLLPSTLVLLANLVNFNITGGSVEGVEFSCIAIQAS